MKAISIAKPFELSIETKDETWAQGAAVTGLLKIKNLESSDHEFIGHSVAIGHADIKKVHAKTAGCFKISQNVEVPAQKIKGKSSLEFPFEFKLDHNISVSDKKSSFHLLYGNLQSPFHMQLTILPQPLFLEIIKLFDTFFRFKVKEYKGTTKGIDYIFTPPTSREYASVESLSLSLSTKEQDLILDFTFNLKKLDLTGISNKLVKEVKTISKTLTPKEYLMGKNFLDQDKLLKSLEAVLSEVKRKELISP